MTITDSVWLPDNGWETDQYLEFCKKTCGNSTIINRIYDIK